MQTFTIIKLLYGNHEFSDNKNFFLIKTDYTHLREHILQKIPPCRSIIILLVKLFILGVYPTIETDCLIE